MIISAFAGALLYLFLNNFLEEWMEEVEEELEEKLENMGAEPGSPTSPLSPRSPNSPRSPRSPRIGSRRSRVGGDETFGGRAALRRASTHRRITAILEPSVDL